MRNLIMKYKEYIMYALLAVCFILMAVFIKIEQTVFLISQPFAAIGTGIRAMGLENNGGAITLYIFVCIIPLIVPLVKIIKNKKPLYLDIMWVVLSGFMFFMMYFMINPHLIPSKPNVGLSEEFQNLSLTGLSATFYMLLIAAVFVEVFVKQKKDNEKIFKYTKILFTILIIGTLYSSFFVEVLKVKIMIENSFGLNESANIAVIIIVYLLELSLSGLMIALYIKSKILIDSLKADVFAESNISQLKTIIKLSVITIFAVLGVLILTNILYFSLGRILNYANYTIAMPMAQLLSTALIIIFSKIMIKAIQINNENKLTI